MKPQDVIFVIVLLALLFKKKSQWLTIAGLLCLVLSIPLFASWIFFTAERLVYYAAGFILLAIIVMLFEHGD